MRRNIATLVLALSTCSFHRCNTNESASIQQPPSEKSRDKFIQYLSKNQQDFYEELAGYVLRYGRLTDPKVSPLNPQESAWWHFHGKEVEGQSRYYTMGFYKSGRIWWRANRVNFVTGVSLSVFGNLYGTDSDGKKCRFGGNILCQYGKPGHHGDCYGPGEKVSETFCYEALQDVILAAREADEESKPTPTGTLEH